MCLLQVTRNAATIQHEHESLDSTREKPLALGTPAPQDGLNRVGCEDMFVLQVNSEGAYPLWQGASFRAVSLVEQ